MRRFGVSTFVIVFNFAVLAASSSTLQAAHPVVPGFERFYSQGNADIVAAEILAGELNCVSCHASTTSIATKSAPILDGVASRVKASYLQKYLADPQAVKPGTTMPSLLSARTEVERKNAAAALTHYLVSLSPAPPEQKFPSIGAHSYGERLFNEVGCTACHGKQDKNAKRLATSKPLGNLLEKYTLPTLSQFLRDPLHTRPSGRMPSLNLNGSEARFIASYLLKGLPEVANIQYSYYEGSWDSLPNFSEIKPKEVGGTTKIDVSLRKQDEGFGLRFEGFVEIVTAGEYTFHLGSDDGSRLSIDGKTVVDVNGIHPHTVKSGKVKLEAGYHAVLVDYFEKGGEESLEALYEGPGVKKQPLATAMTTQKSPPTKEDLTFAVDAGLAAQGRELFTTLGCASCHQLQENGKRLESKLTAAPLKQMNTARGCLAADTGKAPNFSLSDKQRQALTLLKSDSVKTAASIHKTMVTFNCYACHERDKVGGVEQQRNAWFQGTQQEMGDEGRIPPHLTGVGAKLTEAWLAGILANGANDRPYMHTRMPKFAKDNVGHLTAKLAATDKLTPSPPIKFTVSVDEAQKAGRRLVGSRGLSCIKCHSFGRFKATGIQSIDMQTMAERLREDWFRQYVRNPQLFRQGTRMPSAWPGDTSFLPDLLDGKSDTQIAAVWTYLAGGKKAKVPAGLAISSSELIAYDTAVIYRNFIEGAGPRAIGVGYPEGINIAFDANNLKLALMWQNQFIDAAKHWNGRGQGFQGPLGENIIKFDGATSFALLDSSDAKWPVDNARQLGYKFRGYRLTEDLRPTFRYDVADAQVEDFFDTQANGMDIQRKYTISGKADGLWLRIARGSIEKSSEGWYDIDGQWKTRVSSETAKPVLRVVDGAEELVIPVELKEGKAVIVQDYQW